MKSSERFVIYAALLAFGALNAVFLLSHSGRTAFAEAASFIADTIGPTEAITLVDDDKQLTVRSKDGRVAWGEGDFRQTYTIAFVDIGKALSPMLESGTFKEERENLRRELEPIEKQYQTQLEEAERSLRSMDQNSPEFREKYETASRLYAEYQNWGREVAMKRRDEMDVKHLQTAYKDLTNAVNIVADKLGIDIVLRFIPADREFKTMNLDQALMEVRLRTAVKYPEKLDITTEVLEELGVQDLGNG